MSRARYNRDGRVSVLFAPGVGLVIGTAGRNENMRTLLSDREADGKAFPGERVVRLPRKRDVSWTMDTGWRIRERVEIQQARWRRQQRRECAALEVWDEFLAAVEEAKADGSLARAAKEGRMACGMWPPEGSGP